MTQRIRIIRYHAEGCIITVILIVNGLCVLTPKVAFFNCNAECVTVYADCLFTVILTAIVLCDHRPRVAFFIVMLSAFASKFIQSG